MSNELFLTNAWHFYWTTCFAGTTKIRNLESNIGSLKVKLSNDELREITEAIPISEVVGDRTVDTFMRCSWKFADTPPKRTNF